MYKVYRDHLLGDACLETLGDIGVAIAFAKSEQKRNGGYYYINDTSGNEVWNSNN